MDYRQLTAPCGLDCFNCAVYRATTDDKVRAMVAQRLNIPLEAAACGGCRAAQGKPAPFCGGDVCTVWPCVTERGHEFCFECADFPCDLLHPYADKAAERPHNTKVFNLCLMKRMGVERWAKEKAAAVRKTYYEAKFHL